MDTKSPKLKGALSFRRRFDRTATSSDGEYSDSTDQLPRYTSLKDIILSGSPKHASPNNEPNNITIRNELVKHAASAYVLSATIINPSHRDEDWFSCELCEEMNVSCVDLHSCWEMHVKMPLGALCRPIVELFYNVVHRVRNIGLKEKELDTIR